MAGTGPSILQPCGRNPRAAHRSRTMSLPSKEPKPGRVGVVFSGGPAPAANAVIGALATCFRRSGREVIGLLHGYSHLQSYDASIPLREGEHYHLFVDRDLRGLRNSRGVIVGTSRANPGKGIASASDLDDPRKTERLARVH